MFEISRHVLTGTTIFAVRKCADRPDLERKNNFLEKFFGKDILIVSLEKYILFFAHMEERR